MLLEQFNQQKKNIKLELGNLLNQARRQQELGGKHFRRCVTKERTVTILVRQSANYVEEDIKRFMTYRLAFPNALVEVEQYTERGYCIDSFVGTKYIFVHRVLVDEVTEQMVQKRMRKFVVRQLGLKYEHHLKCEVMKLFKEGKISWDDVIAQHTEGCSI